jgi:hypothetical protein
MVERGPQNPSAEEVVAEFRPVTDPPDAERIAESAVVCSSFVGEVAEG